MKNQISRNPDENLVEVVTEFVRENKLKTAIVLLMLVGFAILGTAVLTWRADHVITKYGSNPVRARALN